MESDPPRFADARGLWWPLAFARELRTRPLSIELAGVRLAVFRDRQGHPQAVFDRCPHRGVALSLGQVTDDGCLECPYHGWRFAGDGSCTRVPFNPGAKRERLGVAALATVERGGLIWVFADESAGADDPRVQQGPAVPEWLERADLRRREATFTWRCHWTRLMENMLDVPHLPFVHRRSIGGGLVAGVDHELGLHVEDTARGFRVFWDVSGKLDLRDPDARAGLPFLAWHQPCITALELSGPPGLFRQHLMCVPAAVGETRLMLVSTRRFHLAADLWLRPFLDWFEDRVVHEDQRIIESSQPAIAPPAGDERSVATDAPTLRFRKWYWARATT